MSYPTSPKFNSINIESDDPTVFSESASGRMQSRKIGGQKWRLTASYAPMSQADFLPIWAFTVKQRGRHGVFTITPPEISSNSGSGTGTVTCTAASAGASSVTIAGLTGDIKAGSFVKFANHTKVYLVTADRSGAGALEIVPPLVTAVAGAEQLIYNSVPFNVRLDGDVQKAATGVGGLYQYEVDMVEAL